MKRDKTGREIKHGDLLKVFHFTNRLRKRKCYMYKLVKDVYSHGIKDMWAVNTVGLITGKFHECRLSAIKSEDIEIISSVIEVDSTDWYERPKGEQR